MVSKKVDKSSVSKTSLYYLDAFKRVNKDELTWNWAAFFFQSLWLLYRKIYVGGISCLILDMIVLNSFINNKDIGFWTYALILMYKTLYGVMGNIAYENLVKERVTEGYHLMNKYRATTLPLSSLGIAFFVVMHARKYFDISSDTYTELVNYPTMFFCILLLILWSYVGDYRK